MGLMNWDGSLDLGHAEIDGQHKRIVELINGLHDAMRVGKGKEVVGATLKALIDYTSSHFAAEEKIMERHQYPALGEHRRLHRALLTEVETLQARVAAGKSFVTTEVMDFLQKWLVEHISREDKKFSVYMARQAPAARV
jgi:hemerythrin